MSWVRPSGWGLVGERWEGNERWQRKRQRPVQSAIAHSKRESVPGDTPGLWDCCCDCSPRPAPGSVPLLGNWDTFSLGRNFSFLQKIFYSNLKICWSCEMWLCFIYRCYFMKRKRSKREPRIQHALIIIVAAYCGLIGEWLQKVNIYNITQYDTIQRNITLFTYTYVTR